MASRWASAPGCVAFFGVHFLPYESAAKLAANLLRATLDQATFHCGTGGDSHPGADAHRLAFSAPLTALIQNP